MWCVSDFLVCLLHQAVYTTYARALSGMQDSARLISGSLPFGRSFCLGEGKRKRKFNGKEKGMVSSTVGPKQRRAGSHGSGGPGHMTRPAGYAARHSSWRSTLPYASSSRTGMRAGAALTQA